MPTAHQAKEMFLCLEKNTDYSSSSRVIDGINRLPTKNITTSAMMLNTLEIIAKPAPKPPEIETPAKMGQE